jgi:branched-chain amino acid transport system substrate-binding protein
MKRFLFVFAALLTISGCGKEKAITTPVIIGFIGWTSSPYNKNPLHMSQAVQLSVDAANAKGGINGRPITLITKDDNGKIDKTIESFNDLVQSGISALILAAPADAANAIMFKAEEKHIPVLCPGLSFNDIPQKGDYIIPFLPDKSIHAVAAAVYAAKHLSARRAVVLHLKNDYALSCAQTFKDTFQQNNGKISAIEPFSSDLNNLSFKLILIKKMHPDCIYIAADKTYLPAFLNAIAVEGITTKIITSDSLKEKETLQTAGKNANGVYYSCIENIETESQTFIDSFKNKFSAEPGTYAFNAFDAANVLFSSLEKQQSEKTFNTASLRKSIIETSDYRGVSGVLSFSSRGKVLVNTAVYQVRFSAPVKVASFTFNEKESIRETR